MPSRTTLFGPPGTGKTTTLSKWAQQAAAKHGGDNIMICSLTRTAAAEIRSRDTDVPAQNVGTLHAHAYRSISEDGPTVMKGEAIDEFNSLYPEFTIPGRKSAADDTWQETASDASFLGKYDLFRACCVRDYPHGLSQFVNVYEDFKQRHGLLDFTDMIQYAIDHSDCPAKYIIMDEAQDCSALEFKLLSKWAAQCDGVVIAGDDDQSAYEWRGASVNAFLGFSEDQRVLGQSYRLPQKVKEVADAWIRQIKNRKEKSYLPREGSAGIALEIDYRRPDAVVEHALAQPGQSMILTTCGYQTIPFCTELRERALPFHNPYRLSGDFASTWNPLMSGGKETISASDSVRSFLSPPWSWRSAYAWLRELKDLPRGTKTMLEKEKGNLELIPTTILSSILESEIGSAIAGDLDWFANRLKDDKERRQKLLYRIRVAKRGGLDALNSKPRIMVGTIHSVKGGQADNVYLLPDISARAVENWANDNNKAPVIRQMYIGMTRARERLFLLQPSRRAVLTW
jgi:DNA helicase-2/ATP-dependent DNA helicase PcrA